MSFVSPGFIKSGAGGSSDTVVHETAEQNIQGGLPGEHFHLNQAEKTWVEDMQITVFEPLCSSEADTMFSSEGDAMYVLRTIGV